MGAPRRDGAREPSRGAALRLEALLGAPLLRAAARARLGENAQDARALRRLEERFRETREELRDVPGWSSEREERLIARVLAATTRAEPARAFTRRSRVWPWIWAGAAAGLVACFGALAHLDGARGAASEIVAETRAEAQEFAAHAATLETPAVEAGPGAEFQDELALARRELASSVAEAHAGYGAEARLPADAPLELRLLEARAKGLREHRWDTWLKEVSLAELDRLSLALWCEVELDRFLLSGERPPAWRKALTILEQGNARPAEDERSSKLLAHALDRAREYGLADEQGEGMRIARLDPGDLWSRQWFDDLEAAGHEAGLSETGVWRAWVDWRGR